MDLHSIFDPKYASADKQLSSVGRNWRGAAAEVRRHPAGTLPARIATKTEVTFAVTAADAAVDWRRGCWSAGETQVRDGTMWICPIGEEVDTVRFTGELPEMLHLYLDDAIFADLAGSARLRSASVNVRCVADADDPFIRHMVQVVYGELQEETASGRILVEACAQALVARLAGIYGAGAVGHVEASVASPTNRIARAIEFIEAHVEDDLSIAQLASVACLSPFHFARAFKAVTGETPQGFVSRVRLERAKAMLDRREASLAEIALRSGFSSQAAFNRSFRRIVGCTPGDFRRRH